MKKLLSILLVTIVLFSSFSSVFAEESKERFNLFEEVKQLEERPFEFEEYKGKNLIVSFWTTWCPHCIHEIPDFGKFKQTYGEDVDILMVHVPSNSKIEDAEKMLAEKGLSDSLLLVNDDKLLYTSAFGISGFPTNFVFDKEGYLVHAGYGTTFDALEKIFTENSLLASN